MSMYDTLLKRLMSLPIYWSKTVRVFLKNRMMIEGTELDHAESMDKGPIEEVSRINMETNTVQK